MKGAVGLRWLLSAALFHLGRGASTLVLTVYAVSLAGMSLLVRTQPGAPFGRAVSRFRMAFLFFFLFGMPLLG
jgi:hypothetical protein